MPASALLATTWPVSSIVLSMQTYKPVGPAWSGFYDWLRDSDSRLLGVRYHPCEQTGFVLRQASELDYAQLGSFGDVCLFFSYQQSFDPKKSVDQEFLYDQVFVANDGTTAICFAKDLTQEELNLFQVEGG